MFLKIFKISLFFISLFIVFVFAINFYVLSFWDKNYFSSIEKLPGSQYWIVFWASVNKNGSPSLVLEDRLIVAKKAYEKWIIKKIIVSGFVSNDWYNEPSWMKKYLIKLWIPEENIIKDEKWVDTYNSLVHAKVLVSDNSIILFTQDFQLKRAIYIAEKLWLNFSWMQTNLREYKKNNYFRELWARIKAFLEVDVFKNLGI